jgi:hypothetical protein
MKGQNIIQIGLLAILLFQSLGIPGPAMAQTAAATCETRGVWLNPYAFENDAVRSTTLQNVRRANLNTLFVLVPPIVIKGVQRILHAFLWPGLIKRYLRTFPNR